MCAWAPTAAITGTGTRAPGRAAVNDSPGTGVDLVVMDDFIYGEPQVQLRRSIDVDGNGTADALTDGLLLLRYLFGLRGVSLVSGAFDASITSAESSCPERWALWVPLE